MNPTPSPQIDEATGHVNNAPLNTPVPGAASPAPTPNPSQTDYSKATFNTQYQQKMPQIKQTVQSLRNQGIGDDKIMSYLVSKGVYQMPAAPVAENTAVEPTQDEQSLSNALGDTLNKGGQAVMSDVKNMGNTKETGTTGQKITGALADTGQFAGDLAGDVANTTGGLVGDVIAPFIPDSVKSGLGDAGQTINNKMTELGIPPNVQRSLGNFFSSILLEGGAKAEPGVVAGASKVADAAGTALTKTSGAAPKAADVSEAVSRVTPDYDTASAAAKTKLAGQKGASGTPRINEGGIFKNRSVNPTSSETESGTELSKVPGYSSKLTNLETHNLIHDAIGKEAKSMRASLSKETAQVSPKEITQTIKSAVDDAEKGSLIFEKGEPVVSKYMATAQKAAGQSDGSLEGVLNTRQALDDAYYSNRGKMAYGDTRINTLDEIHQASRNALNQMLHDNAKGLDVKASLKKQSNLYRADDGVLPKIAKEGGSKAQRFIKSHPTTTKVVKNAAKAIGLGAVEDEIYHHL